MALIRPESSIEVQSLSEEGAREILAGTPVQGYADTFLRLSREYRIDTNWILSYLQWESGFGSANSFSLAHNNLWDILCYPGQWGAVGCNDPGNGYSYAVYPDMATGIEAGYRLWRSYVERGWSSWFKSLSVALCGNAGGCDGSWVGSVIAQANRNAERWPYSPPTGGGGGGSGGNGGGNPPPIILPSGSAEPPYLLVGAALVGAAALVLGRR